MERAPFHSHIWTARLPLVTTVSTKKKQDLDYDGLGSLESSSACIKRSEAAHDLYTTDMGETKSLPQLEEHREAGVYSLKMGVSPKKKKKKNPRRVHLFR